MTINIRYVILATSIVLGNIFVSPNSINALERKHIFNLSDTADFWDYKFKNNLNTEFFTENYLNISQYLGVVKSSDTKNQKTSGNDEKTSGSNKNEIIIAVIGFLGILVTAILSNLDPLLSLGKGTVLAKYTGYIPTGNFETELRYFFEVSGTRKNMSDMQKQMMNNIKVNLKSQYPQDSKKIDKYIDECAKDVVSFEKTLDIITPVYQNHFSIDELQELNKFYSTEIMQNMNKKLPAITFELAPIFLELQKESYREIFANYDEIFGTDDY